MNKFYAVSLIIHKHKSLLDSDTGIVDFFNLK